MGNIVFLRKIFFDQACCRTLLFILIFMRKQVQEEKNMKNKTVKALAIAMTVATVTMMGSASIYASDDTAETATEETADDAAEDAE